MKSCFLNGKNVIRWQKLPNVYIQRGLIHKKAPDTGLSPASIQTKNYIKDFY